VSLIVSRLLNDLSVTNGRPFVCLFVPLFFLGHGSCTLYEINRIKNTSINTCDIGDVTTIVVKCIQEG
jgi:hypothetical protein